MSVNAMEAADSFISPAGPIEMQATFSPKADFILSTTA